MNPEAKKIVRELYKNENHRHALEFIRKYQPGLEMVEDLKNAIEESFGNIAPQVKLEWTCVPETSRDNNWTPQEIKACSTEFGKRTGVFSFWIIYLLRAKKRVPDIGDHYTMLVAAWWENEKGQTAANSLSKQLGFPETKAKIWKDWEVLWEGNSYSLQDFGEKDVKGLNSIFVAALEQTYDRIKAELSKLPSSLPASAG